MSNHKSKRKGQVGELEFVNLLKKHGFNARRRGMEGAGQSVDVECDLKTVSQIGTRQIYFEVKRRRGCPEWIRRILMFTWSDRWDRFGAFRLDGDKDWYVVMDGLTFIDFLKMWVRAAEWGMVKEKKK